MVDLSDMITEEDKRSIFNIFDDKGLLVGIERMEEENNIELRNRIVDRKKGNSTKQGLTNWISNIFDIDEQDLHVIRNRVFYSTYAPLSKVVYLNGDYDEDYMYPYVVEKYYDSVEDEWNSIVYDQRESELNDYNSRDVLSNNEGSSDWYVYRNPDGSYYNLWITDNAPEKVEFHYQIVRDDQVFEVVEGPDRPEPIE